MQALDEVFNTFNKSSKSLVVGINIGILLNFSREGDVEHTHIKDAINSYIQTGDSQKNIVFINFEDYSKFEMIKDNVTSTFIHQLLDNVTQKLPDNPFYQAYQLDTTANAISIQHYNFQLLCLEPIKRSIVELLVTIHLKYDQFLTTRSILDFIYTLLTGPKILIDQLFDNESNSIVENIRKEDPCLLRTAKLDSFILERTSKKIDLELVKFIDSFNTIVDSPVLMLDNPRLLIRTFYLFRHDTCGTNYHQSFKDEFHDHTTTMFLKLLHAHKKYSKTQEKALIRKFYTDLENAIMAYANKQLPYLSEKGLLTLSEINSYAICTNIEFYPDWEAIEKHSTHLLHLFPCFLKVNNHLVGEISISLNIYRLIQAINEGYRPNKHDRNTIIIFEELIEKIIELAKVAQKLVIIKGEEVHEFKNHEGEIEVKSYAK